MKQTKHFLCLLLLMMIGNVAAWGEDTVDELTWTSLGLENSSSYNTYSGITLNSSAVYTINAASNSGKCIQLRSNNSNSGIITTSKSS